MRPPRLAWALLLALVAVDIWATRGAWLSVGERLALVAVAACIVAAAALLLGPLRLPAWLTPPALLLLLWMPRRWYPWVHTGLALVALSALAAELRLRKRMWAVALALSAALILRLSSNLRFVAFEQTPLSGALLDGVVRLLPQPITDANARRSRHAEPTAPLPQLGDADIVLITVDALRADRLAHMPRLDGIQGLRFERAYAQAPSTALSISGLLTGNDLDGPTLAERLRRRRWLTQAFYPAGLFFDGRARLEKLARSRFGFEWTDTRTLPAAQLTDAVLERLSQLQSEPRLFLWVHYFDTHEPYAGGSYDAAVATVDREIGRLLDGLGRLKRPVILCLTADHGEELGDHGGAYHNSSVYEEQVRVPLIVAAPGLSPHPIAEPVELADVAPLLLSLAGVEPARPLPSGHDAHSQVSTRRMLVRGNWKLIHDQRRDFDELYDLLGDPRERHNLFEERREVAAPLHAALDQWFNLASPGALEKTLRDGDPLARAAAAHELGQIEAGGPALREALGDGDAHVRAEAALSLAAQGDDAGREVLLALLPEAEWRHRAAVMLGRLRDPRGVPGLIEALRDIDPTLRRHAAHYLGWLGGDESIAPLTAAVDDVRVRADAYLALGRVAQRTRNGAVVAFLRARLAAETYEDARANLKEALRLAGP